MLKRIAKHKYLSTESNVPSDVAPNRAAMVAWMAKQAIVLAVTFSIGISRRAAQSWPGGICRRISLQRMTTYRSVPFQMELPQRLKRVSSGRLSERLATADASSLLSKLKRATARGPRCSVRYSSRGSLPFLFDQGWQQSLASSGCLEIKEECKKVVSTLDHHLGSHNVDARA